MGQSNGYDRFISDDGTSIAYWVAGDGAPVVLVHGYTVTSTTNFRTHYRDDGAGQFVQLVATEGPTIASALVDAGCQVVMLDLRGHGRSGRPHDPGKYSMEIFADDVRALVRHLGISSAALAGYSFGAWISCHLLADPWVTRVALTGIASDCVEGESDEFCETLAAYSRCFMDDGWDDNPDFQWLRMTATLDGSDPDFQALGLAISAGRPIPRAALASVPPAVPVMVLNGGPDGGASDDLDLARLIPGADELLLATATTASRRPIRCSRASWPGSSRPSTPDSAAHIPLVCSRLLSLEGSMFVTSRGYRIRYQAFGDGPPLVLLHGHPMWGDRWADRGYVTGLQDRFRVIVPDLLGHGDSDKPHDPAAYGDPSIAADVLAVLDREGAETAHVWGYSWGSSVAEHLAVTAPARVLSLVLGGFPIGLDAARRAAIWGETPASIEEMFAGWPPEVAKVYIARNDFRAIQAMQQTVDKFPVSISDLQAVARPTLAYYGTGDDYFDMARSQAAALPSCRFESVPGDHVMAFAQAGNILPAAIAHFEADPTAVPVSS